MGQTDILVLKLNQPSFKICICLVQDACKRDSGGPLVSRFGTKSTIVGIVSWGLGCAAATYPGVYTRFKNNLLTKG